MFFFNKVFSLKFLKPSNGDSPGISASNVQAPARACFGRSARRLPGAWTPSSPGSRCTTGGLCDGKRHLRHKTYIYIYKMIYALSYYYYYHYYSKYCIGRSWLI